MLDLFQDNRAGVTAEEGKYMSVIWAKYAKIWIKKFQLLPKRYLSMSV